jgi:hypothetical protein
MLNSALFSDVLSNSCDDLIFNRMLKDAHFEELQVLNLVKITKKTLIKPDSPLLAKVLKQWTISHVVKPFCSHRFLIEERS